ncbi:hypothetical protein [Bradyrhizobium sacchari]|uniref:hypothetical protein n=1 Tax=Bradyrhizobium sacchari TaxID=1399419 RepID=UPI001FDA1B90|nr:hypothetical protein [Bradyrhizobium sacchari]
MLSMIAIRLAVLVVVGWSLTLLPQQARNSDLACVSSPAAIGAARPPANFVDAALDDMLRHD